MDLKKLYKKIGKKLSRTYHRDSNIIKFTFEPHYGLTDKEGNKIKVKLIQKKECYHQWRYFNRWCQECSEFGHGVIVSHCFKCSKMWDRENEFWTQKDINNVFFNEHFQTKQ